MGNFLYRKYSEYLKEVYGEKVYKIPVNLPVLCPNRVDGSGPCAFCGDVATGFESLSNQLSVSRQIQTNMEYIGKRYKAEKFIVYFQNFTNTYMPLEEFETYMNQSDLPNVAGISVSTRPDCIRAEYLDVLGNIRKEKGFDITVELGLQTVNYKVLNKINRMHTLGEYIDAHLMVKKYGFKVCTHMMLNLPGTDIDDAIEGAKILSALKTDFVKLHSLYILKGTPFEKDYLSGDLEICSFEEYTEIVIAFLEHLDPDTVVERLFGRAPKEKSVFENWGHSWRKLQGILEQKMLEEGSFQGKQYNYLNGKAVKKFFQND